MPAHESENVYYHFDPPDKISAAELEAILKLISAGAAVGMSWAHDNLKDAYLIGYATTSKNRIVGCMVLKHPKKIYLEKIKDHTGLDLSGFLERGYTSVVDSFRGCGIAGKLIKGLNERAKGKKIYVTIRMDNEPAVHLTKKYGMRLAGRFMNTRTGHEIGVFINQPA
jgi:hypothetical protein